MTKETRIQALFDLGDFIRNGSEELDACIKYTALKNAWFTEENQRKALEAISLEFLSHANLSAFANRYDLPPSGEIKRIGLIPAANIPMVGFHDLLCIFLAGHKTVAKLSERDRQMLPFLIRKMIELHPEAQAYFTFPETLSVKELDGIIATGSNNSSRYFEQYFGSIPHIIRKNRTSVAILSGQETEDDLFQLGKDVFRYFGLGCRNVSHLVVPEGYDFNPLLEQWHKYNRIVLHHKYKNNFDYQFTLFILNKIEHLNNGCIILAENEALVSPISVVYYSTYGEGENPNDKLKSKTEEIQCIVSASGTIPFGKAQEPAIDDFADGVDTMEFLLQL